MTHELQSDGPARPGLLGNSAVLEEGDSRMSNQPRHLEVLSRYAAMAFDVEAQLSEDFAWDSMTRRVAALVQLAAYPSKPDVNRTYSAERWIEIPRYMWRRLEARLPSDVRAMVYALNYEIEKQVRIPLSLVVTETVKHYRVCPHKSGPLGAHTKFLAEGGER